MRLCRISSDVDSRTVSNEVRAMCRLQASSNTLLAHFISIVLAQWLLRVLNKGAQPAQPQAA